MSLSAVTGRSLITLARHLSPLAAMNTSLLLRVLISSSACGVSDPEHPLSG